jgi:hypothetical protein
MAATSRLTLPGIGDWHWQRCSRWRAMIDAAHETVSFDDAWAINNRNDFKRAVKAMLAASAVKRE